MPDHEESVYPDIFDLQFSDLEDLQFWFGSGAGAWCTIVGIHADGTFSGYFHDSDAGDMGTAFPKGTRYECIFSGTFSALEKVGDYEYSMKCETLILEATVGEERIEDGVRIINTDPYGFDNADEFILYLPGKKVAGLPEGFLSWVSMPQFLGSESADVLDFYGLYNVGGEQGFSA